MHTKLCLDFADADAIAQGCRSAALALGARVTIAVADDAGALIHLQRLDGAKAFSVDLASRKARTAATLGISTMILEQMAKDGRLPAGDIVALGGGLPILQDGHCAGAVAVSGATSQDDERIASAGLSAWTTGLTPT